jgi:hypothetical protein
MSAMRSKPVVTLSAMLLLTILTGCATTSTTGTGTRVSCAGWRPVTFSAKHDSKQTIQQARTHNAVGRKLGCWK